MTEKNIYDVSPSDLINLLSPLDITKLNLNKSDKNELFTFRDSDDEFNNIDLLLKKNDLGLVKEIIYDKYNKLNKSNNVLSKFNKNNILMKDFYIYEEFIDLSNKIYDYKIINIINDTTCINNEKMYIILNYLKILYLIQNNKFSIHFTNRACYNEINYEDINDLFKYRTFQGKSNLYRELNSVIKNNNCFSTNDKIIIVLLINSIDNYDLIDNLLNTNTNKNLFIKIILFGDINLNILKEKYKFVDILNVTKNIYYKILNNDFYKFLLKNIEKYQNKSEIVEKPCLICNMF